MPTAYSITFEASRPLVPTPEHVRGLVAALIEPTGDPDHGRQLQLFSVRPMRPLGPDGVLFELRLNWLIDDAVADARLERTLSSPHRLGAASLRSCSMQEETATYQELIGLAPLWECDFRFPSPTYFSRSGRDYLLPDPELIVRGLLARWNSYNPPEGTLVIPGEAARGIAGRVIVKRHDIRTVRAEGHGGSQRRGFVGDVRLGLRNADRQDPEGQKAGRVFAAICAFAPYCEIGAQTTHCFGAVDTHPLRG